MEFTTKDRKKVVDTLFKNKIVPLFNQHGFKRHTKTSKRLFKTLEKELSVFVFFEYKSRFGSYDITIVYFDDDYGNVYDDNYLAMANCKKPSFRGDSSEALNLSIDQWMLDMESVVFPFIEQHATYKSILASNDFYISKAREREIKALMKRKSES
ncbi:hypothetical protein [Psychroserpens damuponensis]|uniref:hypothetical protein n=1 Tax=Psychroserpens damuponensis TaxID=943936 RepID=UPI00058DE4AA|nr:hypothetical protein [Psychroserpens damuponensis]